MNIKITQYFSNTIFLFVVLFCFQIASAQIVRVPQINIEDFKGTEADVLLEIDNLKTLMVEAEKKGIDLTKEKMTMNLAEVFLVYADWDEKSVHSIISDMSGLFIDAKNDSGDGGSAVGSNVGSVIDLIFDHSQYPRKDDERGESKTEAMRLQQQHGNKRKSVSPLPPFFLLDSRYIQEI